jgi:hypothetical protein
MPTTTPRLALTPAPPGYEVLGVDSAPATVQRRIVYSSGPNPSDLAAALEIGDPSLLTNFDGWGADRYESGVVAGRSANVITKSDGTIIEWSPADGCAVRLRVFGRSPADTVAIADEVAPQVVGCATDDLPPPSLSTSFTVVSDSEVNGGDAYGIIWRKRDGQPTEPQITLNVSMIEHFDVWQSIAGSVLQPTTEDRGPATWEVTSVGGKPATVTRLDISVSVSWEPQPGVVATLTSRRLGQYEVGPMEAADLISLAENQVGEVDEEAWRQLTER